MSNKCECKKSKMKKAENKKCEVKKCKNNIYVRKKYESIIS